MKDSEKGKFEEAWHKAFDHAEQAPSEGVWAGVEQGLIKAEAVTMRRRVVVYQRLAAASILFALIVGGLSTYYISDLSNHPEISLSQKDSIESDKSNEGGEGKSDITANKKFNNPVGKEGDSKISLRSEIKGLDSSHSSTLVASLLNQTDNRRLQDDDKLIGGKYTRNEVAEYNHSSLLTFIPQPAIALKGQLKEITIVRKLPVMPSSFMTSRKDKQSQESLWASLGASTGNYSPSANLNSAPSPQMQYANTGSLSNTSSAYSSSSSKGSVFSVGLNVGKRVSKHWLLQGGVSYFNQAIGYTSNYAVLDANNTAIASVADYSNLKSYSSVMSVSSPYEINSVNQFISIPVQAGYLLLDKKVGLQLNSGVATDFFIQNTLTDKSGQLASYSSGAGGESPYRAVSWAGLLGTELSYKIATQYRISIAPGLRYSLNSVLKTDVGTSNPLVWDIGFRFRYIFN